MWRPERLVVGLVELLLRIVEKYLLLGAGRERLRGNAECGRTRDKTPTLHHALPHHFKSSAALSMPALAHASSFSPPGEPDTATAPSVSPPTTIGRPPCAAITCSRCTSWSPGSLRTRCSTAADGSR